jgi:EamA domain-containing membrane protein RarD
MCFLKKIKEQLIFGFCIILSIFIPILLMHLLRDKKQVDKKQKTIEQTKAKELTTPEWIKHVMRPN